MSLFPRAPRKGFAGVRWTPKIAPNNPEELPKYLFEELQALSDHILESNKLHLERTHMNTDERAPDPGPVKPDDGDIIFADNDVVGTKSGLYYYKDYDDPSVHSTTGQWWFLTAEDPS
jgi:hypothetical protein